MTESAPSAAGARAPGPSLLRDYRRTPEQRAQDMTGPIQYARGAFEEFGDIYSFARIGRHRYMMRHPDHLHEVLVTKASSFEKWKTNLEFFLGDGLFVSEGETWRRQRRIVQPAFRRERIADYSRSIVDLIQATMNTWKENEVLDVGREMMRLTLRVACRTLFGYEADKDVDTVAAATAVLQWGVIMRDVLPKWLPAGHLLRRNKALRELDEMVYRLIDAAEDRAPGGGKEQTLLDSLREAIPGEAPMSRAQLRDEIVTLLFAGHETTALCLMWTFYLLAMTPEEEAKLHHELDTVLKGRAPTFEDLEGLEHTRRVIQESLRICPPLWLIPRLAIEDVEIGGFRIEAGADVLLWVYHSHLDPRWFPEPHSFKPDRFLPDSGGILHPHAYLPFGAGQRLCVGSTFAMVEAQLALAMMAQKFRFELVPGQTVVFKPRATLLPKDPLRMRVVPRA